MPTCKNIKVPISRLPTHLCSQSWCPNIHSRHLLIGATSYQIQDGGQNGLSRLPPCVGLHWFPSHLGSQTWYLEIHLLLLTWQLLTGAASSIYMIEAILDFHNDQHTRTYDTYYIGFQITRLSIWTGMLSQLTTAPIRYYSCNAKFKLNYVYSFSCHFALPTYLMASSSFILLINQWKLKEIVQK